MISKKTINAIELCVLLASQRNAGYLATTELSPRLGISISHLENILKPLRDCGLVAAIKGPGGRIHAPRGHRFDFGVGHCVCV